MKNLYNLIFPILMMLTFLSCAKKGEPSKRGQVLTIEQIKNLKTDQSLNGKLVEVEGYPAFCGMMANVTLGAKSKMEVHTGANCDGEELIEVNLLFGGNTTKLSGEKERNYVAADKDFDNSTLKFITDDYQELPNGKFKFTGTLIYMDNTYYLDNVIINK